jgi:hypothetical protein
MKRLFKILLFFFLFYVLASQNISLQAQSSNTPIWMEKGTFVQYEFKSAGVIFLNNTLLPFEPDASVTWRWECIELDDDVATLNVSIRFSGEESNLFISNEVYVNTTNRQLILSNGTLIGTTNLWAKANPTDGEEIVVWDIPPDRIFGVAKKTSWAYTPQGAQKIYNLEGSGIINDRNALFDSLHDVDTGIMVDGIINHEATLFALGIDSPGINGRFSFTGTNIDLGPRELGAEILGLIPIIIVAIIFISVFVIFYYRRKKRRQHR